MQSGETVMRDGTLPDNSKLYDDKLMAVEMEGSGFAAVSELLGLNWLIFRGISDFGDPEKGDRVQPNAALAAATYAYEFLRSGVAVSQSFDIVF